MNKHRCLSIYEIEHLEWNIKSRVKEKSVLLNATNQQKLSDEVNSTTVQFESYTRQMRRLERERVRVRGKRGER